MDIHEFNILFLGHLLDKLESENKIKILLGDFNIDFIKIEANQ